MERPKFKIWDTVENQWFKPIYDGPNGKIDDLHLSPSGELCRREYGNKMIHESMFCNRFTVHLFTGLYDATPWEDLSVGDQQSFIKSNRVFSSSDWKGREMYDGDIVRCGYNSTYDYAYYQVVWRVDKGCWWMRCVGLHHSETGWKDITRGGYCEGYAFDYQEEAVIIGNINENPGLLRFRSGEIKVE